MLVDLEQLSALYHQLSSQAIQQKASLLILVAPDVDALASCRMFTVGSIPISLYFTVNIKLTSL